MIGSSERYCFAKKTCTKIIETFYMPVKFIMHSSFLKEQGFRKVYLK
jgi:hypothetical protein